MTEGLQTLAETEACEQKRTHSGGKDVKDLQVSLVDGKKQEICTFAPKGDYSKNNAALSAGLRPCNAESERFPL